MPSTEFELIRHGRTRWNAERRFLGVTDLPLDEVGLAEVAALGSARRGAFTAIWSSPLARARATAEVLRPPEVAIDPDLRELAQGELEGLDGPTAFARYAAFFESFAADPAHVRPPGGESLTEARDRAMAALHRMAAAATGGRIAVVTHQMIIASVVCTVRGQPLSTWRAYGVPNAGSATLAFDGRSFAVVG